MRQPTSLSQDAENLLKMMVKMHRNGVIGLLYDTEEAEMNLALQELIKAELVTTVRVRDPDLKIYLTDQGLMHATHTEKHKDQISS